MSVASGRSLAACLVWGVLLGTFGCAPRWTPPPRTIGRVAVLPPCDVNGAPFGGARPSATSPAPAMGLGAVLMSAAGNELTARGVRVWDAAEVAAATGGRVPATPEMAADIVATAKIDATALFIRVRRWEYTYPALKADEIIVGLDVMLVDPATREIVWEVRRPTKPVPLHGVLMAGQADIVAAQEVMREVFGPFRR